MTICERHKGAEAMETSLSDLLRAAYSLTTPAAVPVGPPLCSTVPNLWLGVLTQTMPVGHGTPLTLA